MNSLNRAHQLIEPIIARILLMQLAISLELGSLVKEALVTEPGAVATGSATQSGSSQVLRA